MDQRASGNNFTYQHAGTFTFNCPNRNINNLNWKKMSKNMSRNSNFINTINTGPFYGLLIKIVRWNILLAFYCEIKPMITMAVYGNALGGKQMAFTLFIATV